MNGNQDRPSVDLLDERALDVSLVPLNKLNTSSVPRLKSPIWEEKNSRMGASRPGGLPRRSKRSKMGSKKGPQSHDPRPMTRQDESLDDDVSPRNSVPGTPRLVSVPTKQTLLLTERTPELSQCLLPTHQSSNSTSEVLSIRQPPSPARRKSKVAELKTILDGLLRSGPSSPSPDKRENDGGLVKAQPSLHEAEAREEKRYSAKWLSRRPFRKMSKHRGKSVTNHCKEAIVDNHLGSDEQTPPDLAAVQQ